MTRAFKIIYVSFLLLCFGFNSLLAVTLNENLSFSINSEYAKSDALLAGHAIQFLSSSANDNEILLENEFEKNNEEQISEHCCFNYNLPLAGKILTFGYQRIREAIEPQSLNILYCILRI